MKTGGKVKLKTADRSVSKRPSLRSAKETNVGQKPRNDFASDFDFAHENLRIGWILAR